MMKASQADVIAKLLVDLGLASFGATIDWRVTKYSMVTTLPNRTITVYNTTPVLDGKLLRTGELIKHPGFTIMLRCEETPTAGWEKGVAVEEALTKLPRGTIVTIGSGLSAENIRIQSFMITSGLVPIGKEKDGTRQLFTINGTVTMSLVTP